MLAIISDLHFSDGSTSTNVPETAFIEILFDEIMDSAIDKDAKEVKIILLGDIFDLGRTDYWMTIPKEERPWNGELSEKTAMNVDPRVEIHNLNVLKLIMKDRSSKAFIAGIKDLYHTIGVPFEVVFVIGNHDRTFHNFQSMKDHLTKVMNPVPITFVPWWQDDTYRILCRHGHEWSDECYGYELCRDVLKGKPGGRFDPKCYQVQTIGEVVTAEIMSGLIWRLKSMLGVSDPVLFESLKDANNVRPEITVLDWLTWIGRKRFGDRQKELVYEALINSLDGFLGTELADMWDELKRDILIRGDLVDRIQLLRKIIAKSSFDELRKDMDFINWSKHLNPFGKKDAYVEGAKMDFDQFPNVDTVVYGHTHEAKQVVLRGSIDGAAQRYLNTGTYLPLIDKATEAGFARSLRLSLTFIYGPNEDSHADNPKVKDTVSLEFWMGMKQKQYKKIQG